MAGTVERGRPSAPAAERKEQRCRVSEWPTAAAGEGTANEERSGVPADLIAAGAPTGIAGTAYDTAWLASVPTRPGGQESLFPSSLQWLADHQLADGSWGGSVRYEQDRIVSTLAALVPLAMFGRRAKDRACVAAGVRALWQRSHLLASQQVDLVGFELLLPSLIRRAEKVGLPLPPNLDVCRERRAEKLRLIPPGALYSPYTTIVHSLEFLGEEADPNRLHQAQWPNGSIGNSPAATAFYLGQTYDPAALGYLEECRARTGGALAPVLAPCETFELLWAAYHLFLAGVPADRLLGLQDRYALCQALAKGGVSLSPSFPIPDADDTAVALLLLHDLGETVDPSVLKAFAGSTGYFVSFPYERHASVGVNLHVLQALLRVPGYPDAPATIARLVNFVVGAQVGGAYWVDKWHISPYYATAHALRVLAELPEEYRPAVMTAVARAQDWLRQTQNRDGSWGFFEESTAEETAYAVLALAGSSTCARMGEDGTVVSQSDRKRCVRALHYLQKAEESKAALPPLWIDKCLYLPTAIVRAVIRAATIAGLRSCGRSRPMLLREAKARIEEPIKEQQR